MLEKINKSLAQMFLNTETTRSAGLDLFSEDATNEQHGCIYGASWELLGLPHAVTPAKGDLDAFFADVATFHPSNLPISAYIHIFENGLEERLKPVEDNKVVPQRLLEAGAGAAIAEVALSALASKGNIAEPSYAACRRSLAYTLTRANYLYPSLPLEFVNSKWKISRGLARLDYNPQIASSVLRAMEIISGETSWPARPKGQDGYLMKAISHFLQDLGTEEALQDAFFQYYSGISDPALAISGLFDKRMEVFDRITQVITSQPTNSEPDGIALAFFCNKILPGSFSHIQVIARLSARYPSAVIWYGIFSALSGGRESSPAIAGIKSKLIRDLTEIFSITARPSADISIDELEVLSRLPLTSHILKSANSQSLKISLLPGVEIYSRLASGEKVDEDIEQKKRQMELENNQAHARELLIEAINMLDISRSDPAGSSTKNWRKIRR